MTDKSQSPGSKKTRAWDFGWAEAEGLNPFQRLTGGIFLPVDDSEKYQLPAVVMETGI